MITIGRMAERYGKLPHEIEQNATTYDFMIMDVLSTYEQYQHQKKTGKIDPSLYQMSQQELMEINNRSDGVR